MKGLTRKQCRNFNKQEQHLPNIKISKTRLLMDMRQRLSLCCQTWDIISEKLQTSTERLISKILKYLFTIKMTKVNSYLWLLSMQFLSLFLQMRQKDLPDQMTFGITQQLLVCG